MKSIQLEIFILKITPEYFIYPSALYFCVVCISSGKRYFVMLFRTAAFVQSHYIQRERELWERFRDERVNLLFARAGNGIRSELRSLVGPFPFVFSTIHQFQSESLTYLLSDVRISRGWSPNVSHFILLVG